MERLDQVKAALAGVPTPLFLARESASRPGRFTLHTTAVGSAAELRKEAETALRAQGIAADCRVVAHKPAALARKQSLEAFEGAFGEGETVFDPTGAIGRAAALVACAASLRAAVGDHVRGVLMDAERRALFVVLDRGSFSDMPETMLKERVEAMGIVAAAVTAWRAVRADSFEVAIRVGFELPVGIPLVPVDRRSESLAKRRRHFLARLRKPGIAATLASIMGLGTAAQAVAADLTLGSTPGVLSLEPAVAAPNLGLIAGGGVLNGDGFTSHGWAGAGLKATVPLGEQFGGQLDAAVGGDSYYGIGGHIFWRDPSRGMLGVVASHESMLGNTLTRFAVEGEAYTDKITFRGEVGGQTGATTGAFGGLDLIFYPTPNFSLSVGGEFGQRSLARASVEWQPAVNGLPGLSVFADGTVGGGDSRVLAGLKYYFGTSGASIKDRDRKYDPGFSLFNTTNLRADTVVAGYGYGPI